MILGDMDVSRLTELLTDLNLARASERRLEYQQFFNQEEFRTEHRETLEKVQQRNIEKLR